MSKYTFYAWSYEYQRSDGEFVRIVYGLDPQPTDKTAAREAAQQAWLAAQADAVKHSRVVRKPRLRTVHEDDMKE